MWFTERWVKSSRFSASELRVLRELLPRGDVYSDKLFSQAKDAPYVECRLIGTSGCEATIPYVSDSSRLIECETHIRSPELEVIDANSGRRLRFFTDIRRGGFLSGIAGYAVDDREWPKNWRCEICEASTSIRSTNWLRAMYAPLEATSAVNDLVFWSLASGGSISDEQRALVRVAAPATQVDINDCEERLLITLCQEYKELVRITNGFGITRGRPYEILGTRDIRYIGEGAQWVEITPLYEDGSVAMKNSSGQLSSECYLLYLDGSTRSIGDLKKHVRDSLVWKQDTGVQS